MSNMSKFKQFCLQFCTWWNGQTLNTRIYTWLYGEPVGSDPFGNRYYRTKGGVKDKALGFQRRWVIFNGLCEASAIPPGWYGWLHHCTDEVPNEKKYQPRSWELPYLPNMTGTEQAYRPPGSVLAQTQRQKVSADYDAWTPDV